MKFHRGDRVRITNKATPDYGKECYVTFVHEGPVNLYNLSICEGRTCKWSEGSLEGIENYQFDVGDRIRVEDPIDYSIETAVLGMKTYAGKIGTITEIVEPDAIYGGMYSIDVDGGHYYWRGVQLTPIENMEKSYEAYNALFGKEVS